MTTVESPPTPEEIIAQVEPVIRKHAASGEIERRLAPEVVAAMIDAGVFRAWVPKALGGLELDPLSALRIFEGIAHADGSAGWVASNSANAAMLGQVLPDEGAAEIFSDPKVLLGGAAFPPGAATPVEGGYRVTGQWNFGSACAFATWMLGAALVMEGEAPRLGPDGNPVMAFVLFKTSDMEIVDNWNTLGMRGTGSHDFRVQNLFVPDRCAALLGPFDHPGTAYKGPLYRMGFWLDAIRIAITALGIARAALDAFVQLAERKTPNGIQSVLADRPVVQDQVARARAMIEAGRATVYQSVEEAWEYVNSGPRITTNEGISMALASSFGVELAVKAVDILQGLAGTTGIRAEHPFQQYFRDIHTINQHALANASRFESLGKLILGRQSDWPFYYL
ncbi:MAG TPA: acyl-CoA dehydrogenase family protein [Dehalococcoidia bacterium]|nr:acyl-CoA dehydrogenase family protein [Dehalococcoidia bacterium]